MSESGASDPDPRPRRPKLDVGLCAECRHAHQQPNRRGSVFWRCGRAEEDPRFLRYPPLPVRECVGYERRGERPGGLDA